MYSEGIERAFRTALAAHGTQTRKGQPDLPYVTHPVHVALMLARVGVDEEVIQAALLHDVVEDCEDWTLERVGADFGARVRGIVAELTEDKDKTWEERKRAATEHAIGGISSDAALVKAADKLHNLSTLATALRAADHPDEVWRHFSRGPEQTLENAERLVAGLLPKVPPVLGDALASVLRDLQSLAR